MRGRSLFRKTDYCLYAPLSRCGLTWLVERDVTVLADSAQEELNSTSGFDTLFVVFALANEIFHSSVQDIYLRGRDIDWQTYQRLPASLHPDKKADRARRIHGT